MLVDEARTSPVVCPGIVMSDQHNRIRVQAHSVQQQEDRQKEFESFNLSCFNQPASICSIFRRAVHKHVTKQVQSRNLNIDSCSPIALDKSCLEGHRSSTVLVLARRERLHMATLIATQPPPAVVTKKNLRPQQPSVPVRLWQQNVILQYTSYLATKRFCHNWQLRSLHSYFRPEQSVPAPLVVCTRGDFGLELDTCSFSE